MTISILHPFISSKPDGVDASLIQPSNWNDVHMLTLNGAALLGKPTSGDGVATEITLGDGLAFAGNTLVATNTGSHLAVLANGTTTTTNATSINFTGAAVSVTAVGGVITVDVTSTGGTGGGAAATNLSVTQSGISVTVASDTGTDAIIPAASALVAGVLTAADKSKLDGVSTGATANDTNAQLRDRSTHTGSQAINTVSNLQTLLDSKATPDDISSVANSIVGTAPALLNTLGKIATAIGNDATFSNTITSALSGKAPSGHTHSVSAITDLSKSGVGLGNVDNTSDVNKPISTLTQAALSGKAATGHLHAFADITGLTSALADKAVNGHTHVAASITDFSTAMQDAFIVPQVMTAAAATSVAGSELVGLVKDGVLEAATVNQLLTLVNSMIAKKDVSGNFIGMSMPGAGVTNDLIVISSAEPINDDGRPNGTIYIKVS